MDCQHLSQLLGLQTQNPKICQTFEIFGTNLVLQNLSKEENWSQYVCSRERGASIQILMFVFLFCNSSKRKRLFFPAKNSLSKCQHNFLWASRETKAESSIFLVIAQRVKHFLLLKEKCQVAISRSWKETNEKYLSLSKRCLKSQGCLALFSCRTFEDKTTPKQSNTGAHPTWWESFLRTEYFLSKLCKFSAITQLKHFKSILNIYQTIIYKSNNAGFVERADSGDILERITFGISRQLHSTFGICQMKREVKHNISKSTERATIIINVKPSWSNHLFRPMLTAGKTKKISGFNYQ